MSMLENDIPTSLHTVVTSNAPNPLVRTLHVRAHRNIGHYSKVQSQFFFTEMVGRIALVSHATFAALYYRAIGERKTF